MEILTSVRRLFISFKSLVNDFVYSFGRAALLLLVEVYNHTVPVRERRRIRDNCVSSLPAHDHVLLSMQISKRETFGKPVAYHSTERPKNTQPFKLVTIIFMCCSYVSESPRITAPCLKTVCNRYFTKFKSTLSLPLALRQVANLQCQTAAFSNLQSTNIHCSSRHTDIF